MSRAVSRFSAVHTLFVSCFLCDFGVVMSVSQSARVSEIVPGESSLIAQFFFNPVRQEKTDRLAEMDMD